MPAKAVFWGMLLISSLIPFYTYSCTLTMGYRTSDRAPLIAAAPNNNGLYKHFYQLVAEKLGCELNIIRGPKKRILKQLQDGDVDFYPGFNFNEARANYTFYIENGFPGGEIGISRQDFPQITALKQLEGHTILQALGSPDFVRNLENVKIYTVPDMSITKAIGFLRKKRGDFYIYNRTSLLYYLKTHHIEDIQVHPNCCGGVEPIYLGFSRQSIHFKEQPNLDFDQNGNFSPNNFPTKLEETSLAYKMMQVLLQMKESGETEAIYQQYY
ncbi:substrate-binding periplasmic protein [Vibrio sp. NTOU-M3]|uniref:substrate-binding periplasmic protein n=1 Tax=Vibrio sp. NTOU-M3 TaxID=3234954 RepID=UPI00349FC48E